MPEADWYTLILPADLETAWAEIEPVVRDMMEPHGLDPAELLNALRDQSAVLFHVEHGWFVLTADDDDTALVWIAKAYGPRRLRHYMPLIEQLSVDAGFSKLAVKSKRSGMHKALGPEWESQPCGAWQKYVKELVK